MARNKSGSCCLKGCLTILIVTLLIIGLIVGAAFYVLNMTFDELGIADTEIFGDMTIRDLGLADTKLIDVFKAVRDFLKDPDEADIVNNPYDPQEAAANLNAEFGFLKDDSGNIDYGLIMGDTLYTDDGRYLVTLADTDIAYMMDQAIQQANEEGEMGEEPMPMSVREITISKASGGTYMLRVVVRLDLSSMKDEIANELAGVPLVSNIIPNAIYFVGDSKLLVSSEGVASAEAPVLTVNGSSNVIMDVIMQQLNEKVSQETELEEEDGDFMDMLGEALSGAFCQVVNNIGEVGTADIVAGNKIDNEDSIQLGIVGVGENYISMITRLGETVPEEDPIEE